MSDNLAIRSFGNDVRDAKNDPVRIAELSGLDWPTTKHQAATVFPDGTWRVQKDQFHLHKGERGDFLAGCTKRYIPHQNSDILGAFADFSNTINMDITAAGSLDNGRRVFAVAETDKKAAIEASNQANGEHTDLGKNGDIVQLQFLLSSGHVPGVCFSTDAIARRLVCSNGMTVVARRERFRITHKVKFSDDHREAARQAMLDAYEKFTAYIEVAQAMRRLHLTPAQQRNYIVHAMQPALFAGIIAETQERMDAGALVMRTPSMTDEDSGKRIIDAILTAGESRDLFETDTRDKDKRVNLITRRTLDGLRDQPGANEAGNSLWNAHNAITYHIDNQRGRTADTGNYGAYFGDGAKVKSHALDLAVEYTQAAGIA